MFSSVLLVLAKSRGTLWGSEVSMVMPSPKLENFRNPTTDTVAVENVGIKLNVHWQAGIKLNVHWQAFLLNLHTQQPIEGAPHLH